MSLDAAGLSLHEGAAEPVTAGRFQLRANLGPGSGAVPDETRISFRLDALVMPAHARGPLGNTMDFIQADIEVHGALFPGDLAVALADWREADGALEIRESQLRWGKLDLAGRGALSLDGKCRDSHSIPVLCKGLCSAPSGTRGNINEYNIVEQALELGSRQKTERLCF